MYDTMRDDYITGDAYWVGLKAKITLMKKYGFIKENFSREEMHKLWTLNLLPGFDTDVDLENEVTTIAQFEEDLV